jgi:hypothetical protein
LVAQGLTKKGLLPPQPDAADSADSADLPDTPLSTSASEGAPTKKKKVKKKKKALKKARRRQQMPTLRARDRRTLEVRTFFPLPREIGQEAEYRMDLYLFFPPGFSVSDKTLTRSGFYRDFQTFLRLRAPELSLNDLADLEHPDNPGCVLRQQLPALLHRDAPPRKPMAALAQMYGAEAADAVEQRAALVKHNIERASKAKHRRQLESMVVEFCDDVSAVLGSVRRLRAKALAYNTVAHSSLLSSLSFAEEYVSAVAEENLSQIAVAAVKNHRLRDGSGLALKLRLHLAKAAEQVHLNRVDPLYANSGHRDHELYAYRLGLLKKELQQALYIDSRQSVRDPFVRNSAAMVAAGLAATWATLAQLPLWTGGWTSTEGAFFLGAAVGAYILKDRIKEWVRNGLSSRLIAYDVDQHMAGDTLARVGLGTFSGRVKERMRIISDSELPESARHLRRAQRTVQGITAELETVVHYQRALVFNGPKDNPPPASYGVQELLRFSLDNILNRLDDPVEEYGFYEPVEGRFSRQEMPRTYHLNAIAILRDDKRGREYQVRSRVVVNRKGILRVEAVNDEELRLAEAPTHGSRSPK